MSESELLGVFAPVSARKGTAISLAMQRLWLVGRITPAGARLRVRHVFRSAEKAPLEVIYAFGLPRDAALRRFLIKGEGFSVKSDLKPVDEARKDYEAGLADGHTAALAQQYGDGRINLTVGNIRPGEEVTVDLEILAGVESRDDGFRFRFPFTLAPAYHARARAAEVRPGVGEIELPEDEFGDLVLPPLHADAASLHEVGFDLTAAMPCPIVETASPSHSVRVIAQEPGRSRVSLATAKDVPNRDLVLDVRAKKAVEGVLSGTGSDGKGHFAAIISSEFFKKRSGAVEGEPRRVVFLIDRSGSMSGAPIEQARKSVEACLGVLGEQDSFGLIAFDDHVEAFGQALFEATRENREKAKAFLAGVDARGGTELAAGLQAASKMLRAGADGQGGGDVFVVTDGQVSGTERIIASARAEGIRIHCLGIGSASQDRFLSQLARETGGVSRFLTPRERVDLGAVDLFASIGRPLAADLDAKAEGFAEARITPLPPKYVFSGTPVLLTGETSGPGAGRLSLAWSAAEKKLTSQIDFTVAAGGEGETIRLLRGARLITDLESRLVEEGEGNEKARGPQRVKSRLIALSQEYGLASTQMALVAVIERAGDKPGDLPVTRVVPVGMAQDVEMDAYLTVSSPAMPSIISYSDYDMYNPVKQSFRPADGFLARRTIDCLRNDVSRLDLAENRLLELAAHLEPDGGMPGKTEGERVQATVLALLQFLADGHNLTHGAFRAHVRRLVEFLEKTNVRRDIVEKILALAKAGGSLPGNWDMFHLEPALWKEIESALE